MLLYMAWVLVSFFAVIGLTECILGVLRLLSMRKIRSVTRVTLRADLEGREPRMEYLLNSLSLMADQIDVNHQETILEIHDAGLDSQSRRAVEEYCEKNPWVLFTE